MANYWEDQRQPETNYGTDASGNQLTAPGASYPGATEDHPGFNEKSGCCSRHPSGCAAGGVPYFADQWVAQQKRMSVPPPGQRHAAGYMEPDEAGDYMAMLKRRQAQGLPPDPRDGGEEGDEEDEYGPDGPRIPRPVDLPNYTFWGALLRLFSR